MNASAGFTLWVSLEYQLLMHLPEGQRIIPFLVDRYNNHFSAAFGVSVMHTIGHAFGLS